MTFVALKGLFRVRLALIDCELCSLVVGSDMVLTTG